MCVFVCVFSRLITSHFNKKFENVYTSILCIIIIIEPLYKLLAILMNSCGKEFFSPYVIT